MSVLRFYDLFESILLKTYYDCKEKIIFSFASYARMPYNEET